MKKTFVSFRVPASFGAGRSPSRFHSSYEFHFLHKRNTPTPTHTHTMGQGQLGQRRITRHNMRKNGIHSSQPWSDVDDEVGGVVCNDKNQSTYACRPYFARVLGASYKLDAKPST